MADMTMIQIQADSVPELLRATRGAAGLSTRAIAEMVGVSHTTVSAWERGAGEPSVTQFIHWARATNQAPEQLLQGLMEVVRPKGLEPLTFWSVVDPDFWSSERCDAWSSLCQLALDAESTGLGAVL